MLPVSRLKEQRLLCSRITPIAWTHLTHLPPMMHLSPTPTIHLTFSYFSPEARTFMWLEPIKWNSSLAAITDGGGLVAKLCPTLATPWTGACQAPLSMGLYRQEYWIGLPFPTPGGLPNPGIKPRSPVFQADSLPTELWGKLLCPWNSPGKSTGVGSCVLLQVIFPTQGLNPDSHHYHWCWVKFQLSSL